MSLLSLKKIFTLVFITFINYIKSDLLNNIENLSALRFLMDQNEHIDDRITTSVENFKKTKYNYFFETIRFMNPLNIFNSQVMLTGEDGFKVRCFWVDLESFRVYDLSQLKSQNAVGYTLKNSTENIYFNLCEDLAKKCHGNSSQLIAVDHKDDKICINLAGSIVANQNLWALLDKENPDKGIKIQLNPGDNSTKIEGGPQYITNIEARCANLTDGELINWFQVDVDSNKTPNKIIFESKHACPLANFYEVWKVLNDNKWIFGAAMIVIGIFLNFLGAKFIIFTIFIFTCIITILFFFILIFQFIIKTEAKEGIVWAVLAISLVIGLVFGYFVAKYKNWLLSLIIGSYTGFIVGNLLYNIALKYIQANPKLVLWLTTILSILICIFICYKLIDVFIIFATSLNGSYFIVRGISLFAGGFPSENVIIDLINKEEFETLKQLLTPVVYVYIVTWIALAIFGMYVQNRIRSDIDKEKLNDNYKFFSGK